MAFNSDIKELNRRIEAAKRAEERAAQKALLAKTSPPPAIPFAAEVQRIIEDIAQRLGVTPELIYSYRRAPQLDEARTLAVDAIRKLGLSMPEIARALHRKDHTTVLHHIRKMKERDPQAAEAARP